jgi:hypothetical protein
MGGSSRTFSSLGDDSAAGHGPRGYRVGGVIGAVSEIAVSDEVCAWLDKADSKAVAQLKNTK